MPKAGAALQALRDNRSASILKRFNDTRMCLNETGPWTGISPTDYVTWNGSETSRPTRDQLDGFLFALWHEWNLTLTQSSATTSPARPPIDPLQSSADASQPAMVMDANKTRMFGMFGFISHLVKRVNGSYLSRLENENGLTIENEIFTAHTRTLLGGLVLSVGAIIGLFLLVLLALLLVLHFVRKRRIARDLHYDWGFYDERAYYQQSPRTPAASGRTSRAGVQSSFQQTRRVGAGAGERQLSPSPKPQQALHMHLYTEPADYTPLEEPDANSAQTAHAALNRSHYDELHPPSNQYQSALLVVPEERQLQLQEPAAN